MFEKLVLVTRKTRLEELIERFNTRAQAKFYIEHAGGDFSTYESEHDAYQRSLERGRLVSSCVVGTVRVERVRQLRDLQGRSAAGEA